MGRVIIKYIDYIVQSIKLENKCIDEYFDAYLYNKYRNESRINLTYAWIDI